MEKAVLIWKTAVILFIVFALYHIWKPNDQLYDTLLADALALCA